jgi:hypothetical protein
MFSFGFRKTENRSARVALAIYVSLSVAELVSAEFEKTAKSLVLAAASRNVS